MSDLIDRYQNLLKTGFEYAEQDKGSAPTSNFEIYMGHFANLFSEIHTAICEADQRVPEGWKLVPIDDESREVSDSALPFEMIEAGIRVQEQVNDDHCNYVAGVTTDWDCGMVAVAMFRAMCAAAPALIPSEPNDAEVKPSWQDPSIFDDAEGRN